MFHLNVFVTIAISCSYHFAYGFFTYLYLVTRFFCDILTYYLFNTFLLLFGSNSNKINLWESVINWLVSLLFFCEFLIFRVRCWSWGLTPNVNVRTKLLIVRLLTICELGILGSFCHSTSMYILFSILMYYLRHIGEMFVLASYYYFTFWSFL